MNKNIQDCALQDDTLRMGKGFHANGNTVHGVTQEKGRLWLQFAAAFSGKLNFFCDFESKRF